MDHIGSKEELLAAIHDRVMDEAHAGVAPVVEAGGTPPPRAARRSVRNSST